VITSKFFEDSNFQIIALKDKTGIINATLFTKKQILFNETKIYLIKGEITEYKTARQVKILTISIQ
jgi:23S rRNA maturation-related 3'-5' exoribonuclease YhaM